MFPWCPSMRGILSADQRQRARSWEVYGGREGGKINERRIQIIRQEGWGKTGLERWVWKGFGLKERRVEKAYSTDSCLCTKRHHQTNHNNRQYISRVLWKYENRLHLIPFNSLFMKLCGIHYNNQINYVFSSVLTLCCWWYADKMTSLTSKAGIAVIANQATEAVDWLNRCIFSLIPACPVYNQLLPPIRLCPTFPRKWLRKPNSCHKALFSPLVWP